MRASLLRVARLVCLFGKLSSSEGTPPGEDSLLVSFVGRVPTRVRQEEFSGKYTSTRTETTTNTHKIHVIGIRETNAFYLRKGWLLNAALLCVVGGILAHSEIQRASSRTT